ncbi:hypothetical protein N0V82_008844 [Gnomoniopsis sp. IMI 355080]|nr:hypothetical protein N0V82_008844 [Gnomoniopsis sp. IMI 355080]
MPGHSKFCSSPINPSLLDGGAMALRVGRRQNRLVGPRSPVIIAVRGKKELVRRAWPAQDPSERVDVLPAFEVGSEAAVVDDVARDGGGIIFLDPSIAKVSHDDLGEGV